MASVGHISAQYLTSSISYPTRIAGPFSSIIKESGQLSVHPPHLQQSSNFIIIISSLPRTLKNPAFNGIRVTNIKKEITAVSVMNLFFAGFIFLNKLRYFTLKNLILSVYNMSSRN